MNGKRWNGLSFDIDCDSIYKIKNGSGYIKEYDEEDVISFEGYYVNGERHGKGKEYDYDGKLKFEGEYLCGKKWRGKGYDQQKNILYERI